MYLHNYIFLIRTLNSILTYFLNPLNLNDITGVVNNFIVKTAAKLLKFCFFSQKINSRYALFSFCFSNSVIVYKFSHRIKSMPLIFQSKKFINRITTICLFFYDKNLSPIYKQYPVALQSSFFRFNDGNKITSFIEVVFVKTITKRSIPIPTPAAGGIPYSNAVI